MNEKAMDSPLAGNARPEKALWYQEVLALDPESRIFLPYARLLAELGRESEAVDILKAGITRHPEFLEARLFLIEILHRAGQDTAAGLEAEGIIELLSQSEALWRIWSKKPGLPADQAAMLLFFASSMHKGGHSLADVFEAGIAALESDRPTRAQNTTPPSPSPTEPLLPEHEENASPVMPVQAEQPVVAATHPDAPTQAFTMPDDAQWYALDSVPDDDDIYDDEEDTAAAPPVSALLFVQQAAEQSQEGAPLASMQAEERIPAMNPVPRSAQEGKSSLCTRSMAKVLEEQGATDEAADIYRELLEACSSPEEKAELTAKLASLIQGNEIPASPQSSNSGILDMLESLAARLENRNRA